MIPFPRSDWSIGSREQIDDVSHANEARDPKTIAPLSFLRYDWLPPLVAMFTTHTCFVKL